MSATCKRHAWVCLSYRSWEVEVLVCEEHDAPSPDLWHGKKPKKLSQRLTKKLMEHFGEDYFWDVLISKTWGTI